MPPCASTVPAAEPRSELTPLRWIGAAAPLDRCLFVDRDGVINERRVGGYVTAWDDFVWRPGVIASLQRVGDAAALPLVVVTNQACVGRGLVGVQAVLDVNDRMRRELEARGVTLAAWYCCPHAPGDGCALPQTVAGNARGVPRGSRCRSGPFVPHRRRSERCRGRQSGRVRDVADRRAPRLRPGDR